MIRPFTLSDETGLVPIADRLRYMSLARVVFTAVALMYWWAFPADRAQPSSTLAVITGGYLIAAAAGWISWRLGRSVAVTVFGLSLLADGLYLALVAYSPTDLLSPLRYLVLVHVITVTLVASFRTGLKVTVWHTLLLWLDFELRSKGTSITEDRPIKQLAVFTVVIWAAVYCTATFAAINERDLRRRGYDMETLARLALEFERANAPRDVARAAVAALTDDMGLGRVALIHAADGVVEILSARGLATVDSEAPRAGHDDLIARALRSRTTGLVTRSDPNRDPWVSAAFPRARNLAFVPMVADDRTIGLLCLEYGARRGSRIELRMVRLLERIASHTSLALANALLLERMSRLASTDGLTGAANRRTFDERLAGEIRQTKADNAEVSLLLVDVDHFKRVNDDHGHSVGDDVLKHLVRVVADVCRPQDLLARFGGEEFALILPATNSIEAQQIAERARIELIRSQPPVPVTISIGIATSPLHASDPSGLIQAADAALYQAKTRGRNQSVCATSSATRHRSATSA